MPSATLFHVDDAVTFDDLDDVPGRIGRSSLLWVDADREADGLRRAVATVGVDDGDLVHRLRDAPTSAALEDHGVYTRITALAPDSGSREHALVAIDCIVGERWVLTVHEHPVAVLETFRERAAGSGDTGRLDGTEFVATLLDWVLGEYARAFEDVEAGLEQLDVRALEGQLDDPEVELRRLVGHRRGVGELHRALTRHREPLIALTHPELDALSTDESVRRFTALVARFESTVQSGRDARSAVVASFDVLMARIEHRTNEILKILTVASVLFLPGSLLAALLGMNFDVGVFDHAVLFWWVVGLVVTVIVATVVVARQRRWV
jgi:magnesium transporter